MQSIQFYQQRLSELLQNLQTEFSTITEDGIIDYDEALYGKAYVTRYQDQLRTLKQQVHADIKAARAHYKLRLMQTDKASRRVMRDNQTHKVNGYQKVVHLIDKMLLDVEGSKRTFMDTIGEFKMVERTTQQFDPVKSEPESVSASDMDTKEFTHQIPDLEPEEVETQDLEVVKLTVTRDELLAIIEKWQQLAQNMEQKHSDRGATAEQQAQFIGAKNALKIAIEDIQHLFTSSEERIEFEWD